jgi:hypothetical protein
MTTGPPPQDATAARGYPVQFAVEYPDRPLNRLTTAFRPFVAIPIVIVLVTIGGVEADWTEGNRDLTVGTLGGILFVPALLMIVFRQKYPPPRRRPADAFARQRPLRRPAASEE